MRGMKGRKVRKKCCGTIKVITMEHVSVKVA